MTGRKRDCRLCKEEQPKERREWKRKKEKNVDYINIEGTNERIRNYKGRRNEEKGG
jgi:hypothetical protein